MNSRFAVLDTPLLGLKLIQRNPLGDSRGYLERMFCAEELGSLLADRLIVQINHTRTDKNGTVRGMHFQYPPHAQTKMVSCIVGEAFDVAVDIRPKSATYLRWHAEYLSAGNHRTLCIPEGFAHGVQTLTDGCELLYCDTATYQPEFEGGLNPLDPRIDIRWPLPVANLSPRDGAREWITRDFVGVTA